MIWVEILSRHRDVAARMRVERTEVSIGRGYNNDIIIDDPYVAAHHVRVFRDEEGRLIAEDLGSANGMFRDRGKVREQRIVVDGAHPIRIGQSYLRIRDTSHAVEPERVGKPQERLVPIVLVVLLVALIVALEMFQVWAAETGEPKASSYLVPPLAVALAVAFWVAVWALLSRVFSGRAHFERNLLIALTGVFVLSLYNEFVRSAAFALNWTSISSYQYVAMWSILAGVCFFHLREVGPSRLKLKGAVVVAIAALVIGLQYVQQSEALSDSGRPVTSSQLMPPALRLAPLHDEDAFFAEVEQLKGRLERDRRQPR